jgi:hypothetical protein
MSSTPHSEAECLLEQGKLYLRRCGWTLPPKPGREVSELLFAGFKSGAFSLYFGDAPIYHFDFEGRWQRAYEDGSHFLKGLDTAVHRIDRVREGANLVLKRTALSYAEAADLDDRIRSVAVDLIASLDADHLPRVEPPATTAPLSTDSFREMLDRIASWDTTAWFAHRERYLATYGPWPLLPPECRNALVLQRTLGHAGRVSFGGAAVHEHAVRSNEQFEEHLREVSRLLGRRISQSRTVFLAGADVLKLPPNEVNITLDAIAAAFFPAAGDATDGHGLEPTSSTGPDGVHAFLDDLRQPRPGQIDLEGYRARGLRRVCLGVESGEPGILEGQGKSWSGDDLRSTVEDLKSAGLGVSVLTLLGAGGESRSQGHVEATAGLLATLPLAEGDFIFLLDADEVRDPAVASGVVGAGFKASEAKQFKELLSPLRGRGVKVLPYSLEKQWS